MKLDLKALALSSATVWGMAILFVGLLNLAQPTYGVAFLQMVSSVYPGYHATRTFGEVLVGTGYALCDGAVAGWLVGWFYNRLVERRELPSAE